MTQMIQMVMGKTRTSRLHSYPGLNLALQRTVFFFSSSHSVDFVNAKDGVGGTRKILSLNSHQILAVNDKINGHFDSWNKESRILRCKGT